MYNNTTVLSSTYKEGAHRGIILGSKSKKGCSRVNRVDCGHNNMQTHIYCPRYIFQSLSCSLGGRQENKIRTAIGVYISFFWGFYLVFLPSATKAYVYCIVCILYSPYFALHISLVRNDFSIYPANGNCSWIWR